MSSYPTSVKSFTTRTDGPSSTISASHMNDVQDEISAIEDALLNGIPHAITFDAGITASAQPRCSAYSNATQSVNDSTDTYLTLNAEDYDVGAMHDTSSNNTRITVPSGGDGLYLIIGGTTFAADADGYREMFLRKNGTTKMSMVRHGNAGGSVSVGMSIQQVLVLAATDYLELGVAHNAGAAINLGSADRSQASYLQLVRLW